MERSHKELVLLNSSSTPAGRSCLGMRLVIESTVFVGAANRAAGARAKTRLRVDVKIMMYVWDSGLCGVMVGDVR